MKETNDDQIHSQPPRAISASAPQLRRRRRRSLDDTMIDIPTRLTIVVDDEFYEDESRANEIPPAFRQYQKQLLSSTMSAAASIASSATSTTGSLSLWSSILSIRQNETAKGQSHQMLQLDLRDKKHKKRDDSLKSVQAKHKQSKLFSRNAYTGGFSSVKRFNRFSGPRLIPSEHPLKIGWDLLMVFVSLLHSFLTHLSIRDRRFGNVGRYAWLRRVCEACFILDIVMSFFTQYSLVVTSATPQSSRRSAKPRRFQRGRRLRLLRNVQSVWARYLTSWFVVDVLALLPAELIYIQPIIEAQNKRHVLVKSVFRTRAVMRVISWLRRWHFLWLGQLAHTTQSVGLKKYGRIPLVRLMIRYIPKYWLWTRTLKFMVLVRFLRQVRIFKRAIQQVLGSRRRRRGRSRAIALALSAEPDTLEEACTSWGTSWQSWEWEPSLDHDDGGWDDGGSADPQDSNGNDDDGSSSLFY